MRLDSVQILSFSGVDGAGKSTQISALCAHLRELGFQCAVYTFWDNVVVLSRLRERMSLKVFKGDAGIGSPDRPIQRRDKNVSSWSMTIVRLFFYLLDTFSLCAAVARSVDSGADFVIFDRYIYDELANLPLQYWFVRFYIRLLLVLVPRPDVAFLLDADPEAAFARKPEYPLEFVSQNRNVYLRLSRLIRGLTVIPPLPVQQAIETVNERVDEKCLAVKIGSLSLNMSCQVPSQVVKSSQP